MKNRLITIGFLFVFSIVVMFMYNTHTETPRADYAVACLPLGRDMDGSDQMLRDYYHIAHTPAEGGRCYFRFPKDEVVLMNPRQAQFIRNNHSASGNWELSYPSSSGRLCFFKNKKKYEDLVNLLRQKPPVSRNQYGGQEFRSWTQVRDWLMYYMPN